MIEHIKTMFNHPQEKNVIESFNKTFHKGLTKICNLDRDDQDEKIPTILWEYRMAFKKLTGFTWFKLVYGQEIVI